VDGKVAGRAARRTVEGTPALHRSYVWLTPEG